MVEVQAMPIANVLRRLREAAEMTQQQLAVAAGLSVSAVSQIEQGTNTDPRMSTLKALARALGVTVDELTRDNGTEKPPARRRKGK